MMGNKYDPILGEYRQKDTVLLGTTTQIPYMNVGGTDFLYTAKLLYDGTKFTAPQALFTDKIMLTQTDGNEYIDSSSDGYLDLGATVAINVHAGMIFDSDKVLTMTGNGYVDSPIYKAGGTDPVPDNTYNTGVGPTSIMGTITTKGGIITAISQAA